MRALMLVLMLSGLVIAQEIDPNDDYFDYTPPKVEKKPTPPPKPVIKSVPRKKEIFIGKINDCYLYDTGDQILCKSGKEESR